MQSRRGPTRPRNAGLARIVARRDVSVDLGSEHVAASCVAWSTEDDQFAPDGIVCWRSDVVGGEVVAVVWRGTEAETPVAVLGAPVCDRESHPFALGMRVLVAPLGHGSLLGNEPE